MTFNFAVPMPKIAIRTIKSSSIDVVYKQVTTDEIKKMPKKDTKGITNYLFHRDYRYFQILQ